MKERRFVLPPDDFLKAADGQWVSTGKAEARGAFRRSAAGRARLRAQAGFLWVPFSRIAWPSRYPSSLCRRIWKDYLDIEQPEVELVGVRVLKKQWTEDLCIITMALPEEGIRRPPFTSRAVLERLKTAYMNDDQRLRLTTFFEIAEGNLRNEVYMRLVETLTKEYGPGISRTLLRESGSKSVRSSGESFNGRRRAAAFAGKPAETMDGILEQIGKHPPSADLCLAAGRLCRKNGLSELSSRFLRAGAAAEPESEAGIECLSEVEKDAQ